MNTREQMDRIDMDICRSAALYGEWAKNHGITYNMLVVLCALDQAPDCTQKQISVERMIPKQTVNTIIKELERKGYLQISEGEREKRVSFTENGRVYAGAILEKLYQLEDRVMERMGPEMCRAMLESQRAFTQALSQEVHRE